MLRWPFGPRRAVPLMHGSQGCTAFGKVFFVRHFREPPFRRRPPQWTRCRRSWVPTRMSSRLRTAVREEQPRVIGLVTTGLSGDPGTDIHRAVRDFRTAHPEYAATAVVAVNTPDYVGCFESGHALAVEAIINTLVAESDAVGRRQRQVNVLASSMLTPGDIEAIREWTEAFGLRAIVLPDIGDALDGHLTEAEFSPLTLGGTPAFGDRHHGRIGRDAGDRWFAQQGGGPAQRRAPRVPDWRFDSLMGLDACDDFTMALAQISGRPVPPRIDRHRAQLQDAMVDCHFMLGFARVALAGDPDLLIQMGRFLVGVGAEVVAAVSPAKAERLAGVPCRRSSSAISRISRTTPAAQACSCWWPIPRHRDRAAAGRPLLHAGFRSTTWWAAMPAPGWATAPRGRPVRPRQYPTGATPMKSGYRSFYRDDPAAGESHVCTPPAIGVVH